MLKRINGIFGKDYSGAVLLSYCLTFTNAISQVLLIPMYIKYLGMTYYGTYILILSFINYIGIGSGFLSGGILRMASEQYASKDREGLRITYTVSKMFYLGYGLFAGILFALYATIIKRSLFFMTGTNGLIIIIETICLIVVRYDLAIEYQMLVANKKQMVSNTFQIVFQVLYLMVTIPMLKWFSCNLETLLLVNCLSQFAVKLLILLYKREIGNTIELIKPSSVMKPTCKRLLGSQGLGFFIYSIIILTSQADILIMGTIGNAEDVAIYSMTWKVAEMGIQLLWRIPEMMQPYIMQADALDDKDTIVRAYKKINRIMIGLSGIGALVFIFAGRFVIKLWMGQEYVEIDDVRLILTGMAIFWLGIERLPAILAYSTLRLKQLDTVAGIEIVIKVIAFVMLYPRVGIIAPLIAINIEHILGIAYSYYRLGRNTVKEIQCRTTVNLQCKS